MSKPQVVEAFYFATDKSSELENLIQDFPDIFNAKPVVPVNFTIMKEEEAFQLRANNKDLIYNNNGAHSNVASVPYSNRKLSSQRASVRKELSKALLLDIMLNKQNYQIFTTLENCQCEEEENQKIWLFTDESNVLKGSFSSDKMQKLFENGFIKPNFLVKKKFDTEFMTMVDLMNRFLKLTLMKKIENGALIDNLVVSSRKIKSYVKHMDEEEKPHDIQLWVDAIFRKKIVRQLSNKSSATQSTRESARDDSSVYSESDTNSQAFRKISVAFTKPKIVSDETQTKHIKATTGFGSKNFSKFSQDSPLLKKPAKVDINKGKKWVPTENQESNVNEKVQKTAGFKHEFDAFMGKKKRRNNKKTTSDDNAYQLK